MIKSFTCFIFLLVSSLAKSQITTYITSDIQKVDAANERSYRFDRMDKIIKYKQFLSSIETPEGYYSIGVNPCSPSQYGILNIYFLDKELTITKELNYNLKGEDKEFLEPLVIYRNEDKIELICCRSSKRDKLIELVNWEFNFSDFTLLQKNRKLVTFPYFDKSKCEYGYDINESNHQLGISFFQERTNKEKDCIVYAASFDKQMNITCENNVTLPIYYSPGALASTKVNNDGTVWILIDERKMSTTMGYVGKDISIGTYVASISKIKKQLTTITKDGLPVISAAITTTKRNNNILVSGFLLPPNADLVTTLFMGEVDTEGKLTNKAEYIFPKAFIAKTTKIDKKAKGINDALSRNYYVRDLLVRENGITDAVISYATYEEEARPTTGNGATTGSSSRYGDLFVISFLNNEMVSSLCFNRYLIYVYPYTMEPLVLREYTIPQVFTKNNNLYITLNMNEESFESNANDPDLKDKWLTQAIYTYRLDNNFKLTKQLLFENKDIPKHFFLETDFQKITNSKLLSICTAPRSISKQKIKLLLFTFK